jgi:hypothetical protein
MCGFTDYCSETGGAPPFHIEGQIAKIARRAQFRARPDRRASRRRRSPQRDPIALGEVAPPAPFWSRCVDGKGATFRVVPAKRLST